MLRKQIVEMGKLLYEKDLTCATSGNISVKTDDGIFITASGTALGFLKLNEIVLMDFDGNVLAGGRPSSEKMLHVEIYKQRPDVKAIIHTHPVTLTSFAACHEPLNLPIMSENILYFEDIPVAPYAMPSSSELVYYTMEYLKNRDVVLMANHGAIAIAENLEKAFLKMETAEYYAKVTLNTLILGKPKYLSDKDISNLIELKNKH